MPEVLRFVFVFEQVIDSDESVTDIPTRQILCTIPNSKMAIWGLINTLAKFGVELRRDLPQHHMYSARRVNIEVDEGADLHAYADRVAESLASNSQAEAV